ncbi:hypothetical protein [Aquibacillus kalidii]|uniref:hypothetical protein n=1 Tax=Aquibacillus kalidii TaxID=2762597 RepID=UPI001646A301|nr:hypothetical protein [Aquibacillus kalidii]
MERWNIRYYDENGEYQSWVFTDFDKLCNLERSLRKDGVVFATDYYQGNELINASDRII